MWIEHFLWVGITLLLRKLYQTQPNIVCLDTSASTRDLHRPISYHVTSLSWQELEEELNKLLLMKVSDRGRNVKDKQCFDWLCLIIIIIIIIIKAICNAQDPLKKAANALCCVDNVVWIPFSAQLHGRMKG